ncbi:hypothetical protein CO657_30640 (plasmid) [Rhizobium acidisoli]|uniref:Uncharacterized protein n=1 Tax=Rhizobium acidisoli TaxID=1538158 RepID=A0AAE6C554_9HYPH|nr:hypothetical protein [Rhizobium acidisoli]KPH06190.1 hypothetical protein AOG23_23420 [Rhizobium acidisoli]QAS82201.1 hypothetical protein CO657_30640 [Rhizobium acidisoli]
MRKEIASNSIPDEARAAISADHLLHPAKHFGHPRDVLTANDIGDDEKRAILASWASDIFAVESIPAVRLYPGADEAVPYDEIIEALKTFDGHNLQSGGQDSPKSIDVRRARRRRAGARRFGGLGLSGYRKGDRC